LPQAATVSIMKVSCNSNLAMVFDLRFMVVLAVALGALSKKTWTKIGGSWGLLPTF